MDSSGKHGVSFSPNYSVLQEPWNAPPTAVRWILRGLAVAALSISILLAWIALTESSTAGCGEGSADGGLVDCNLVLSSRWAHWFRLPVAFPAVSVYATLLVALIFIGPKVSPNVGRLAWRLVVGLAVLAAGAAVWFIGLQLLAVGAVCVYCLAVHTCGVLILIMVIVARTGTAVANLTSASLALAAVAVLIFGQVAVAPPPSHRIERIAVEDTTGDVQPVGASNSTADEPGSNRDEPEAIPTVDIEPTSRKVLVMGGKVLVDVYDYPTLGPPSAPRVVVKLFDYTCPHCRSLHKRLVEVVDRYNGQLAVVMVPVPLSPDCNPKVRIANEKHKDACKLIRLALAINSIDREKCREFEEWLFGASYGRPIYQAMPKAEELVGAEPLKEALRNPKIDELIEKGLRTYEQAGEGQVPKLLFPRSVIHGDVETGARLEQLIEEELGLE